MDPSGFKEIIQSFILLGWLKAKEFLYAFNTESSSE